MPAVLSRLLPPFASAFALQALPAAVFVPQANEKYYDLCGTLTFLSSTAISLYYPFLKAKFWEGAAGPLPSLSTFAPRQLLLSAAVYVWSIRLGNFLVRRAVKAGGDSRFDHVRHRPVKFTVFWMIQAVWICVVGLPVYMVNSVPSIAHPPLGMRDYASLALLSSSFIFEVIADRQKSAWRNAKDAKEHDEKFITSGLWSLSRHPNYLGEIGIWTGIWALSTPSLQTAHFPSGSVALAAVSPLFTGWLLRKVSGVPPLEKAGDKKFGDDPKWLEYKRTVPVFWPWGGYE